MSRKLIVNDGRRERELLLVGTMVVGRDPACDISDADPLLSRRHVEFIAGAKDVIVRDLGSRNGILINGVKIAQGVLRGGDVVQIGHLQLRFVEDSAPLVAAPEIGPDNDETAMAPPPVQRPAAPKPPLGVETGTIATHSTRMDEPTERVIRPTSIANHDTVDGKSDKTIPTIRQADPRPAPAPAPPPGLEARIVVNQQDRITEASPGCVDLVGARLGALVGHHLIDTIPDREIAGEVLRCLSALFATGEHGGSVEPAGRPYRVSIVVSREGKNRPLTITFRQGGEAGVS